MAPVECEHGTRCAGCAHLGVPYEAQRANKRERVIASFARYDVLEAAPVAETVPAARLTGYRTRVKWMVGPGGELGLYAREGDHVVLDVPGCRVVPESIASVGAVLRRMLRERTGPVPRVLRAVDLRELADAEPRVWVTLVVAREDVLDEASIRAFAEALQNAAPVVMGVFLNVVARESVQVLGAETRPILGADEAWDRIGGARVRAAPGGFVQAHRGQAAAIAERLEPLVTGTRPRVLDLFAGAGAWGLGLAAQAREVVAVESFAPAARRIETAAREAHLPVRAIVGEAEPVVRALADGGERFELVIVNPPRRGLSPGLRRALAALAPRSVAYVSCDPETLARDVADFARLGLRAREVVPFDMIPLSEHVEAFVVLAPEAPPPPRAVLATDAWLVVDARPHETPGALRALGTARGWAEPAIAAPTGGESGLAIVASNENVLQDLLASVTIESVVLVKGIPRKKGTIERPFEGRSARIRFERLAVRRGHAVLRVHASIASASALFHHLSSIGHPVHGDGRRVDSATRRHFAERYGLERAFAHRVRIHLVPREGGDTVRLASPLPGDLRSIAERLGAAAPEEW